MWRQSLRLLRVIWLSKLPWLLKLREVYCFIYLRAWSCWNYTIYLVLKSFTLILVRTRGRHLQCLDLHGGSKVTDAKIFWRNNVQVNHCKVTRLYLIVYKGLKVGYCLSLYVVVAVYIYNVHRHELFLSCLFARWDEMGNHIYRELLVR